jgi:hypothetical protein
MADARRKTGFALVGTTSQTSLAQPAYCVGEPHDCAGYHHSRCVRVRLERGGSDCLLLQGDVCTGRVLD